MPASWPRPEHPTDLPTRAAGLAQAQLRELEAAARLIREGALAPAQQALGALLVQAPEHPEVLRLLGILHTRGRQYDAARTALGQALQHWPDDPLALTDMGNAEQAAGDVETALAYWRRACALAPDYPMGWSNLGRNLQVLGFTEPAVEALEHACTLGPSLLPAHVLLGDALVHLGRFDEADRRYRAALALHPACGDAWRGLANMKTRPLSAEDRAQLVALLKRTDVAEPDRIALGFALGKASEDQGCYEEAFAAISDANARQRRLAPWHAGGFHAFVESVLAAGAKLPASPHAALGEEAIFIVGLPRSGSTLFEQILAAHPQVEGASELPDLGEVLVEESARRGQPFPRWVPTTGAEDWQRLGRRYLERTARWRRQRPRFTDKLPENWLYSGVLGAMLPGARIVDVRRDVLEAGWSCFKQQFYRLPHFACTLTDIAAYLRDYEAAMDRWQAAAPGRIRTQPYEALLADPEAEIRALLAFCGLPFDPACLDFHRAMRAIRTPSAAQVRQPLSRGTARAEHYGRLLDPLRLGLGRPLAPR
ncbi:tetratricopeptide repeat-containing sulfotransferase family protein [Frateuria terrea]|uniref:Tetratricopeptide repeat-containing protein n=1 Tax=Frateuria terrea TaxID=529704 RepID=A0A1H6Y5J7_9GAMM|nr:sulfotransferase [Frateuria terrea]SEJ34307.1 Tetratricopeptide repeat-containing protein [Frateuria terrea]SFP50306.1 Tetratricopeptide repeat-containing protein [Frateuria terrea]